MTYEHGRGHHRGWHKHKHDRHDDDDDDDDYRDYRSYGDYRPRNYYDRYPATYSEPVYRNTRVWRQPDGPRRHQTSPGAMSSETPRNAILFP